ncbi:MAG: bis(5'-nucleosyl)-tetraphosphatase (symmetrical) YqeK [Elusimicrobia bacterium]|nr:bis(5'-nucleosyl)-tetraphosphatase (symmetrical) YqeK [Elusimicrobiota bacterium]
MDKKILNYLKLKLTKERYTHTLSVAKLAESLAPARLKQSAKIAALLHDAAKGISAGELIKVALKNKLKVECFKEIQKHAPHLLHSYVSAHIAQTKFNINDKQILNAIKYHTTAAPSISELAKIVFVADYCAGRESQTKKLQKLACQNLDRAFKQALFGKINYVLECGQWLNPLSIKAWNYYHVK